MEYAAALRGDLLDHGKPSLFELYSEQQLHNLLGPTLRYLLTVATERHPRYLLRLLNSFDELYAALFLAIETYHLRKHSASFTETFYSLRREPISPSSSSPSFFSSLFSWSTSSSSSSSQPTTTLLARASRTDPVLVHSLTARLRPRHRLLSLVQLVLLPYLIRKLDALAAADAARARLGAAYNQPPGPEASVFAPVKYWLRVVGLRRVYPILRSGYKMWVVLMSLTYLFDAGSTVGNSPLLWMMGMRMRRAVGGLGGAMEAAGSGRKGANRGMVGRMVEAVQGVGETALGSLSVVLPVGIFALKFLEWWYATDFGRQLSRRAAEAIDLPPPAVKGFIGGQEEPKMKEKKAADAPSAQVKAGPKALPSLLPIHTVPAPTDSRLCPICEAFITTPTACPTGVVYCYTCIHRWLTASHPRQEKFMVAQKAAGEKWESGEGRCAVTGQRVLGGTEGLRRIMV